MARRALDVPRETAPRPRRFRLQSRQSRSSRDCPTPSMPRVICLGMSAQDAIYRVPAIPTTPTKVLATGYTECGGGMAASASVAVSRLGGDAVYWGRVGADPLGERILAELAAEGVDVSSVRRVAGCVSPSAAILVDDLGERLVCAYNDPALDRDASWLPLDAVARCQAVLADVRWPEGARDRLRGGRAVRHTNRLRRRHRTARSADRARATRELCRLFGARPRPRDGNAAARRRTRRGGEVRAGHGRRHPRRRWLPLARRRQRAPDARACDYRGRYARRRRCLARCVHAGARRAIGRRRGQPLRERRSGDQMLDGAADDAAHRTGRRSKHAGSRSRRLSCRAIGIIGTNKSFYHHITYK